MAASSLRLLWQSPAADCCRRGAQDGVRGVATLVGAVREAGPAGAGGLAHGGDVDAAASARDPQHHQVRRALPLCLCSQHGGGSRQCAGSSSGSPVMQGIIEVPGCGAAYLISRLCGRVSCGVTQRWGLACSFGDAACRLAAARSEPQPSYMCSSSMPPSRMHPVMICVTHSILYKIFGARNTYKARL